MEYLREGNNFQLWVAMEVQYLLSQSNWYDQFISLLHAHWSEKIQYFLSSLIDLLNFIVFLSLKVFHFIMWTKHILACWKRDAEMRVRHKWSISSDTLLGCLIPSISAVFASGTWLKLLGQFTVFLAVWVLSHVRLVSALTTFEVPTVYYLPKCY